MLYKNRLKELRDRNNLKQKDLLNIVNLSDTQYSSYENEKELMPIKHLNAICNYFNISFDYIFNFTDLKQYENSKKAIIKIISGQRLKDLRKDNNLTLIKFAEILNAGKSTISEYERGNNLIATPFLYDICKKYKISADYLLGKIDSPKYLK